jgi:hypothetical protein
MAGSRGGAQDPAADALIFWASGASSCGMLLSSSCRSRSIVASPARTLNNLIDLYAMPAPSLSPDKFWNAAATSTPLTTAPHHAASADTVLDQKPVGTLLAFSIAHPGEDPTSLELLAFSKVKSSLPFR